MNALDVLLIALLAAAVAWAIVRCAKNARRGGCGCGDCGCAGCSGEARRRCEKSGAHSRQKRNARHKNQH